MRVRKFLAVFLLIIVGTIMCNVTSSFAEEIVYEELVVEIPEGEERNAAHYINEKLAIAASNRDKYYKVIINPRENQDITQYYLINQIRVFSNTWLYVNDQGGAKPVVFNKCHKFAMVTAENRDLEVNGYEGFKNIIIEGGIWNGKTDYYNGVYCENEGFNHFRFAHGRNFEIRNLKIINNNNAHHVQVAGIDGFKVSGCTFEGYSRMSDSYKEAIQIDILSSESVFGSAYNYDDTPMINVDIYNNLFKNVDRGVGTHSATVGVYHKNIKIHDNTFINIDDYAIAMMNYKNAIVEDNVMTNVEGGVVFMYAKSNFSQFHKPNVMTPKVDPICTTTIRNNHITLNNDTNSVGIRSYGMLKNEDYKSVMNKAGINYDDYSVSGITITNNKIHNAKGDGIGLVGTVKSTVSGNTIYYGTGTGTNIVDPSGKGIYMKSSEYNTIINNVVDNSADCNNLKHGIIVYTKSISNTIKQNVVKGPRWHGIYLKESSSAIIDSNTIDNSKKSGIYIIDNATASISNCTINNIATSGNGIYITDGGKASTITNNRITNIKSNGIYISDSANVNSVLNNQISAVGSDGIYVYNKASVGNIHSNTINNAKSEGISIYNKCNVSSIYNNKISTVSDNGIYVRTSSKCTDIKNNTITGASDNGIYVDYKCTVNNILSNVVSTPGKVGIYVNNRAVVNYIKSNKITAAKSNGIYIKNSTCKDVNSNTIKSSKVTYIYKSKVANINSNIISGSSSHGIYIKDSKVTSTNSNKLTSNKSNGMYILNSTITNVNSNTCSSNKNKGIYVSKSKISNIKSNKLNSNKSNGLYMYSSTIKTCSSNSIKSNTSHGLYAYKMKMTSLNSNSVSGSRYNGVFVNASTITNIKSNKVSSSKENGIYIKAKSKIKYLYSNKVSSSKKKAIYIYKSTVSKIKSNSGKVVKKK